MLNLLHRTTLLSLLGLTSSQSISWANTQGFTVANDATSSQEVLIPQTSSNPIPQVSSNPIPPAIPSSATPVVDVSSSIPPIQSRVSNVAGASTFSVSLASPTASAAGTVSTPVGGSAMATSGSGSGSASATSSAVAVQSSAAAAPMKKMGIAGVLAGAAGVMFV